VGKTITKEEIGFHKFYAPIINELREEIGVLKKKHNEQNLNITALKKKPK
jgi:hypothetical protein